MLKFDSLYNQCAMTNEGQVTGLAIDTADTLQIVSFTQGNHYFDMHQKIGLCSDEEYV